MICHKARFLRFDIVHLFLLSAAISLGIAWLVESHRATGMRKEIELLTKLNSRLTVDGILNGSLSPERQVEALADFIKLGDRVEDLREWADVAGMDGFVTGPLGSPVTMTVFVADCDLVIETVDGRVTAIGRADESGSEWIASTPPRLLPTD